MDFRRQAIHPGPFMGLSDGFLLLHNFCDSFIFMRACKVDLLLLSIFCLMFGWHVAGADFDWRFLLNILRSGLFFENSSSTNCVGAVPNDFSTAIRLCRACMLCCNLCRLG